MSPSVCTDQPLLQQRLILHRFLCRELGAADFKQLRARLHDLREGWAADSHSYIYHTLCGAARLRIAPDKLAEYDLRIKGDVDKLNRARSPQVHLKYFQYLAVLFNEIYLDRLFNDRAAFLAELHEFIHQADAARPHGAPPYPTFTPADLTKIAYWMATGSGKTLIMHLNLWQYLRYSAGKIAPDNILLVTPNEGLSRQHLAEFRKSGIAARHYGAAGGGAWLSSNDDQPVTVLEITKLTRNKSGGGLSIDVEEFGAHNLLLVDEGHRGASGETWRDLRATVARAGFTYEYSATFGQIVNGASAPKRADLLEEYSKAIICDYSYPHFYRDGYGKDYWITNLKDETDTFNDWMLLGNLLSFYEQTQVYTAHRAAFQPYHLEKPLWVFVGHTVVSGSSRDDRASLTDVEQIIVFFADFLRRRAYWTARLAQILAGETGIRDAQDNDLFANLFPYLRARRQSAADIYAGITAQVCHSAAGEPLRVVELRAAEGEIGLQAGTRQPYFGVINIGDVRKLMQRLAAQGIACAEENLSGSLFDHLQDYDSPVNLLIGSRKFMEGWDSFRVASMGLMNIGKGEGAQIIQLFGRGVRLWGKDYSLKRSTHLRDADAPAHIELLETLNIFGVRANYMAQFRDYLKQEGIETFTEIAVPIRPQTEFLQQGLQMMRDAAAADFMEEETVFLRLAPHVKVTLNLLPRLEMARSATDAEARGRAAGDNKAEHLRRWAPMFDWQRLYFALAEFKRVKGWYNFIFSMENMREIIDQGAYTLLCLDEQLSATAPRDMEGLRRVEEMALGVLRKYATRLYTLQRRAWEHQRLSYQPLTAEDPNLHWGETDPAQYILRINTDDAALIAQIREILQQGEDIYRGEVADFPHIHFDRHLYLPLLTAHDAMNITPPGLNAGERRFVADLRLYLRVHREYHDRAGLAFFLLRNQARGKGVGFGAADDGAGFYPDFLFWIMRDNQQWLTFIDPHGLRHAAGWDDPKFTLFAELQARAPELQAQLTAAGAQWRMHPTAFIISPSSYEAAATSWVRDYTEEEWAARHVLFADDAGDYVARCVEMILGEECEA